MAIPDLFKDLRLPVIAAPMFLVSGVDLVVEACNSGIIGAFPALNARPEHVLDEWLDEIKSKIRDDAVYGVNVVVHPTNPRMKSDIQACIRHRVPLVLTSLHAPADTVVEVHSYGGLVFHDVISIRHAEKAAEAGVDGLVLVSTGSGGHTGNLNPFALLNEVKKFFKGTIVLAGSLMSGSAVLAAQAMGADMAYMGTRFIATRESAASRRYKEMVVEANAKDIVCSDFRTGVSANYLRQSIVEAGLDPDRLSQLRSEGKYVSNAAKERPKAWNDIWQAGHGVGQVESEEPVSACVDRLKAEYEEAWLRLRFEVAAISGQRTGTNISDGR